MPTLKVIHKYSPNHFLLQIKHSGEFRYSYIIVNTTYYWYGFEKEGNLTSDEIQTYERYRLMTSIKRESENDNYLTDKWKINKKLVLDWLDKKKYLSKEPIDSLSRFRNLLDENNEDK